MGVWKCKSSMEAVTTACRQWRPAATPAQMSIHSMMRPPKAALRGLASEGRMTCVITASLSAGDLGVSIGLVALLGGVEDGAKPVRPVRHDAAHPQRHQRAHVLLGVHRPDVDPLAGPAGGREEICVH